MFCRSRYRSGVLYRFGWNVSKTLILQGVCGLNRYAVPGNRLSVLKCKLRPHHGIKYTTIVQYYYMFLLCQVKMLYTLQWSSLLLYCYYISYCDISRLDIRFDMCLYHKDKTKILSVTQRHTKTHTVRITQTNHQNCPYYTHTISRSAPLIRQYIHPFPAFPLSHPLSIYSQLIHFSQ